MHRPDGLALRALGVALAALLLPLMAPPAEAAKVVVPGSVLDGTVPVLVTGAPAGAGVTVTVGSAVQTRLATAAPMHFTFPGVPAGLQPWSVVVTQGTASNQSDGGVYVDTALNTLQPRLRALQDEMALLASRQLASNASLAALGRQVEALRAGLERANRTIEELRQGLDRANSTIEGLRADESARDTLRASLMADLQSETVVSQAAAAGAEAAAESARAASRTAAGSALAVVVVLLLGCALMLWQARQRHREMMVILLAVSARAGLNGESPEFHRALAALQGQTQGAAALAPADPWGRPSA